MHLPRLSFILIFALWFGIGSHSVPAEDSFATHLWKTDIEAIQTSVIETLRKDFENRTDSQGWRNYRRQFLDALMALRSNLDSNTYQIMKDIMLAMDEDFSEFSAQPTWQDAERYVKTKIDLADSIIGLVLQAQE